MFVRVGASLQRWQSPMSSGSNRDSETFGNGGSHGPSSRGFAGAFSQGERH